MIKRLSRDPRIFLNPDLDFGFFCRITEQKGVLHEHDFTEIAIIEAGVGTHRVHDVDMPVKAGDVFVIMPGTPHAWQGGRDLIISNVILLNLDFEPMLRQLQGHAAFKVLFQLEPTQRKFNRKRGVLTLNKSQLRDVSGMLDRYKTYLPERESPYPTMTLVVLISLISYLCDAYLAMPSLGQRSLIKVGTVIDYIERNFSDQPDYDEMATLINVSSTTFYRLFRDATGETPANYVNRVRIEEACRLLDATSRSITDIAFEVGFHDFNYFSRIFKAVMGVSPRAFRSSRDQLLSANSRGIS